MLRFVLVPVLLTAPLGARTFPEGISSGATTSPSWTTHQSWRSS